jgi:DNA mismatch endonuclease (patch repair protein)
MADRLSPEQRSAQMGRIRGRDTKPELIVRRLVHRMGYRYRLHVSHLPGRPDLVFPSRRKIIFVHGCFWHQHPACRDATLPRSRTEFWSTKLRQNVQRDTRQLHVLKRLGWDILVIWECEASDEELPRRLVDFLARTNVNSNLRAGKGNRHIQ